MSDEKVPAWVQAIIDKHMRAMRVEIAIEHVNRTVLQPIIALIDADFQKPGAAQAPTDRTVN